MKKIEESLIEIRDQKEKLEKLEERSQQLKVELEIIGEERKQIKDAESGFYKDIQKKYEEKELEFKQADTRRMNQEKNINKIISLRREEIEKEIKGVMKYIDENRNMSFDGIDTQELKLEKAKLEKEIKLNNTSKEEFEKMTSSEKNAVRKAKENYLNNKHRLEEIIPIVKLSDTLNGVSPKDKFIQMEILLKRVDDYFNSDKIDELIKLANLNEKQKMKNEKREQTPKDRKNEIDRQEENEDIEVDGQEENKNIEIDGQDESRDTEINEQEKNQLDMKINISKNFIEYSKKESETYKTAIETYRTTTELNKKITKKYGINDKFAYDKKMKKNIDYSLISALEKIDDKNNSLVNAYLTVIRNNKNQKEEVSQSIEKIKNAVNIVYKNDENARILFNLKEKRIARYAKKMGIATLDGVSEKGIFDKMVDRFNKIKNTKLFKPRENVKALMSGDTSKNKSSVNNSTRAQADKMKTINLINQDRQNQGIRSAIKIDNSENLIEKTAQEHIGQEVQNIIEQEENEK